MATLAVYDAQKQKVGELTVQDEVFAVPVKLELLQEVVRWQMAKRRAGTACTKRRNEVSGGGKKPWRQKGTGRARAGSNTSPLWKRGGAVFGPKPRSYAYKLPKKVRALALRMALSDKVGSDKLFVLRDFALDEIKTKNMAQLVDRFSDGTRKAVIITSEPNEVVELSARNIPYVKVLRQEGLNVYDLLRYDYVIIHEPAVSKIEERLRP